MVVSKIALLANKKLTDYFYVHPTTRYLHAYHEFASPVEIAAADSGKIYAYGAGSLQVLSTVNGLER
jgi:hypothetical protein